MGLLLQKVGPDVFRRARIPDLCQEALSQGGLLTREDLAFRIFAVGTRTVSRDLARLRSEGPRSLYRCAVQFMTSGQC